MNFHQMHIIFVASPMQTWASYVDMFQLLQDLIYANHIIHYHGVVDAFGHISVRHPENPDIYFLSANKAPALVSSPSDFVEYRAEDSSALQEDSPRGYIERYIHGEIYKKYSRVQCVIHSHAEEVLPYAISGVPLKPVFHMAGFLGLSCHWMS
jgi:ribulose-5-phosphate 4-epimerase/fuculose-1-phosphate aldolase